MPADTWGDPPRELLQAALQYAERGIPIFPCGSNKRPRTEHGFKDATTDPVQIRRWWQEFPDALIGMPTGERTGIDVLDIDDAAEFAEACNLDLSSFTTVKTRKGLHKWFRRDPSFPVKSRVRPMPGADTRGDGGYVIVPPSRHEDGEYLFEHYAPPKRMPEALRERLVQRPNKAKAVAPSLAADEYCSAYGARALSVECELVRNAPNGEQEFRLNAAALKIGSLSAGGEVDRGMAREQLLAAAQQMQDFDPDKPWTNCQLEAKIERGLDHGAQNPRSAPATVISGVEPDFLSREHFITNLPPEGDHLPLRASPFTWPEPQHIPPRPWKFGRWLLSNAVTGLVAPGGTGKSTTVSGVAVSLASGRDILGKAVHGGPQRVWLFNLEDDSDELARSITAAAQFHGITAADCEGRLFVDSGLSGRGLCTATEDRNGVKICHPEIEALRTELLARQIDVLIVDPFVSSHTVSENNNTAIDAVVKQWGKLAAAAGCSIILSHHSRKLNGTDVTLESARGASALVNAARSVLVFNRLSAAEASKFGVSDEERRRIFSIHDDKHNRAPAEAADWFYLESVHLKNGDEVGAVRPWTPPSPSAGVTPQQYRDIQQAIGSGRARYSTQSPDWAGYEVASVLGLDPEKDRNRITLLLKDMTARGLLTVVERSDSSRQLRKFYEVGASVSFATPAEGVAEHGGADEH